MDLKYICFDICTFVNLFCVITNVFNLAYGYFMCVILIMLIDVNF